MADRPTRARESAVVPDFRLPASTGHTLELDSFLGKTPIVFLFLDHLSEPDRDLLSEVDRRLREFGSERVQVLVVMRLIARDVSQMAEELDLSVPILADENGGMARDFEATDSSEAESRAVAIVTDEQGRVLRRFDPLDRNDKAAETVDSLLDAVRQPPGSRVPAETDPIGSDREFYQRVATDARIPEEQAPDVVAVFLRALVPFLGEDARAVVAELIPADLELPTAAENGPDGGIEDLLLSAFDDSSVASGRPAEHARVVAEALRNRADESQLRRFEAAVDDEDVLSLFETERGELTADHRLAGVSELSGGGSGDVGARDPAQEN